MNFDKKAYHHEYYLRNRDKWKHPDRNSQNQYRRHVSDLLELRRRTLSCACCGKKPVHFDHIMPNDDARKEYGTRTIRDYINGCLQPLCKGCNNSKGDSPRCRKHDKYLGVWNYLPPLPDMELT